MSLIKCEDCGHEVSKHAWMCPNCGNFWPKSKKNPRDQFYLWMTGLGISILILVLAAIKVMFFS